MNRHPTINRHPRTRTLAVVGLVGLCLVVLVASAAPVRAQAAVSVEGEIESTSGGFRFPDGSLQLTAATAWPAAVEDTGLAECFRATGVPRSCTATGEDGEHQAGVAVTPRFVDNLDGTVTDRFSGLMWLEDADCSGAGATWQGALNWVSAALNQGPFTDCEGYTPLTYEDWRVPNLKELLSLLDYSQNFPALPFGHPFVGVSSDQVAYWSSSTYVLDGSQAWAVNLAQGNNFDLDKSVSNPRVWAVRGGATGGGG